MMQCDEVQNLLAAYLDGGLSDEAFAATRMNIAGHVRGCEACRAERDHLLQTLKIATRAIKQAGEAIPVPDMHWQSIPAPQKVSRNNNHFRSIPMKEQSPSTVLAQPRGSFAAGFAFAIILVLLAAGALMFNAINQPQYGAADVQPAVYQIGDQFTLTDLQATTFGSDLNLNGKLTTRQAITESYGLSVTVLDESGAVISQNDDPFLVLENGDSVLAEQTLYVSRVVHMPADAPITGRKVVIAIYNTATGERLPVTDGAGSTLENGVNLSMAEIIAISTQSAANGVPTQISSSELTPTIMPFEPTIVPTVDPVKGGFVNNPIDVANLPEYTLSNFGGGGGGGGGGCPEIPADQTVNQVYPTSEPEWQQVCLYDLPDLDEGTRFLVTLTSPTGKTYNRAYTLTVVDGTLTAVPDQAVDMSDRVYVYETATRTVIDLWLNFPAAQEYGEWGIRALLRDAAPFAEGTLSITTNHPIYSVTDINDPLNPLMPIPYGPFHAGDHVLIAGRGLEINATGVLALYSEDRSRATATTLLMMPYYAAQVTVNQESVFYAEFVVGEQTPQQAFSLMLNPDPAVFNPLPYVGLWVGNQ